MWLRSKLGNSNCTSAMSVKTCPAGAPRIYVRQETSTENGEHQVDRYIHYEIDTCVDSLDKGGERERERE